MNDLECKLLRTSQVTKEKLDYSVVYLFNKILNILPVHVLSAIENIYLNRCNRLINNITVYILVSYVGLKMYTCTSYLMVNC